MVEGTADGITIVIADDHAILRSGLRLLIDGQADMEVIGEAGDGRSALEMAVESRPDVLLLDITMPGMNGLEVMEAVRRQAPAVGVLVLTMHEDDAYLRQFLNLGARGYILKKAADTELVSAIRAVHRGETFVYSAMMSGVLDRYLGPADAPPEDTVLPLTPREIEVLTLVARGYTNEQIAKRLSISVNTVHTHRSHITEKLDLHGRSALVRYALAHGLL